MKNVFLVGAISASLFGAQAAMAKILGLLTEVKRD